MECKVTHRQLKLDAVIIAARFAASSPSLVIGPIFTPPFGKERESRPKLVCDGQPCDGPTGREALGISTAERVFEISDYRQGLGQSGNDTACLPKGVSRLLSGGTGIGPVAANAEHYHYADFRLPFEEGTGRLRRAEASLPRDVHLWA